MILKNIIYYKCMLVVLHDVQVKQGLLEGRQKASVLTEKPFYEFLGIPYAKPPIGDLRFHPPVPAGLWEGVRQSMQEVNKCAQSEKLYKGDLYGSEDCLYLNVFIPGLPDTDTRLKAVMVYIHGGGVSQSRGASECDFWMDYEIIVVTLNYRLGILAACHADEIGHFFPNSTLFPHVEYKDPERTVINNICTLWTNFVKTGNLNTAALVPTAAEWKPLTRSSQSYLDIDKELKTFPGKVYARLEFWSKLLHTNMN